MLTPMEKDRGQKHYSTSASILNPMDVSTSNSNSNTVLPQPSAFLASSMGMGVGADRVSEREREDLSGGFGASSLSFEEVQDGGYHEGYWRFA